MTSMRWVAVQASDYEKPIVIVNGYKLQAHDGIHWVDVEIAR